MTGLTIVKPFLTIDMEEHQQKCKRANHHQQSFPRDEQLPHHKRLHEPFEYSYKRQLRPSIRRYTR